MELLSEQIKIISKEESELLKADKLSKSRRMKTGLYLVCNPDNYIALDFSDRHSWIDYFGEKENAPQGWSREFSNPLKAIDWLLSIKKM